VAKKFHYFSSDSLSTHGRCPLDKMNDLVCKRIKTEEETHKRADRKSFERRQREDRRR
jgi:hypothetical protein